jgi:DNA-3-methyladenine glycosylase II
MSATFSSANYHSLCNQLAVKDADLHFVIQTYGYPPMWTRPNSFETLVHIILEQQVSLASALSALNKLRERLTEITPEGVLSLTDEELKACYFSRQKITYVQHLANAIVNGSVNLVGMELLPNDEIRAVLSKLKGIGNWTIDIYLMFVLQRADIFPIGDLAAVTALKQLKQLPKGTTREEVFVISGSWQPYRTIATMVLWHYYLSLRVKKVILDH